MLVTAVIALVPLWVLASVITDEALARILISFVVGMGVATAIAYLLRSRFIASFSRSELSILPTGRSLTSRAQRHANDLVENGFALIGVVVIGDGENRVFTRPLGLCTRTRDGQAAICGELGVQLVSRFDHGGLCVTASHDVVRHPRMLVLVDPGANVAEVAASHTAALSQIRTGFHIEPEPLDPVAALLQIERYEQATLRDAKGLETTHRSLTAPGDPISNDLVRDWLAMAVDTSDENLSSSGA